MLQQKLCTQTRFNIVHKVQIFHHKSTAKLKTPSPKKVKPQGIRLALKLYKLPNELRHSD